MRHTHQRNSIFILILILTLSVSVSRLIPVAAADAGPVNLRAHNSPVPDNLRSADELPIGPQKTRAEFVSGEILIRFRNESTSAKSTFRMGASAEFSVENSGRSIPIRVERLDAGNEIVSGLRLAHVAPEETMQAVEALKARPDVLYAEPNYIRRKEAVPNDPRYSEMWPLKNTHQTGGTVGADIKAEQAWDVTTGSRNIVVAVIDEGIDVNHQDLQANIWHNPGEIPGNGIDDDGNGYVDDVNGFDFFNSDASVYDGPGTNPDGSKIDEHGTHVAGTIGAVGNNGLGVVGVNWQVSLMSLKFLGPDGGSTADLLKAFSYAKTMRDRWVSSGGTQGANVRVTNNSYGGSNFSQAEADAIAAMGGSGILFVAAAGNNGTDNNLLPSYPAEYNLPSVISVAATDSNDGLAGFSNRGSNSVHLGAPGVAILSTTPGNTYGSLNGTSMASPHVAGCAALVLAAHPEFTVSRMRAALLFGGDRTRSLEQTTITGNRLSAAGSLQNASENDTTPPANIGDLHVVGQEGRNVTLAWTAPGDDGNTGQASLYEIRFTDQSTGANFLVGAPRPRPAGSQEVVDILIPYRHPAGKISLVAYDNTGNADPAASVNVSLSAEAADPYVISESPAETLSTGGTPLHANFDDGIIGYTLPFKFPFFERYGTAIGLSTNGAIYFVPSSPGAFDLFSSTSFLQGFQMIAGLWDDLDLQTSERADADIYVVKPDGDRIIFRWQGVPCNPDVTTIHCTGGSPVNFEIELNRNGTITTRYGDGNTQLHPVVGIGGGEPDAYPVVSHSSQSAAAKDLTNAPTVKFTYRSQPREADLKIDAQISPNPVMLGGNVTYTLTITNTGPNNAAGVTVFDILPPIAGYVSCTTSQGSCSGPPPGTTAGAVNATLNNLASGASATMTIVVTLPIFQSSFSNIAVVSSHTNDPDFSGNTSFTDGSVFRPNPNPLTGITKMVVGGSHCLALTPDGSVLAWGNNFAGQLGVPSSNIQRTPVWVPGIASVKAIGAGGAHSIAIKANGNLWTWGANDTGQLGDGTTTSRVFPAPVSSITNVTAAAGGSGHTIALKDDGTVWTWGDNSLGQIGDNTSSNRLSPAQVPGLGGMAAVAAGSNHSVALRNDGTVWAWGDNSRGQLGDGSNTTRRVPTQVSGLSGVTAIAANGNFTLALRSDGTVWAWGANNLGQLGDGTISDRNSPALVSGLTGVTALAAGTGHSLALRNDGAVWAWGNNNSGQLGLGINSNPSGPIHTRPALTLIMSNAVAIAAGDDTSLGLAPDGTLYSWGSMGSTPYPYQVDVAPVRQTLPQPSFNPDGGTYSSARAVTVSLPTSSASVTAVALGNTHSVSLMSDGTVYSWGRNDSGQLGTGSGQGSSSAVPIAVAGLSGVKALSAGSNYTVALKTDGTVWAWGNNDFGQLGDGSGTSRFSPVQVTGLTDITAISAGVEHTLALRSDGTVWAWGNNTYGGLGDGSQTTRLSPVQVSGLTGVVAIGAGASHSLAVKNDGTVWAWGRNLASELGDGTVTVFKPNPVQVTGLTNFVAVAGGAFFSVALRKDGTVWTWGQNQFGELGNGTNTGQKIPVMIPDFTGVKAISAASETTMALRNDGTVWTWGRNEYRQLGTGSSTPWSYVPVRTTGPAIATTIDLGGQNGAAVTPDGSLWLWGDNQYGQLGNGTLANTISPPARVEFFGSGPVIHYTTNGSDPTDDDPVVASGSSVLVDRNTVLKARVFREGFAPSAVKNAAYIINTATNTAQLSQGSYTAGEAAGNITVTVNRTDSSSAATVNYATSDTAGLSSCSQANTGVASSRCDYANTVGTLRFAAGESSKTISIPLVDDGYVEGPESLTITLSNPNGTNLGTTTSATITITDNDSVTSNPIATVPFFVRQQYIDFLGREPDPGGFVAWQNILNNCAQGDTTCDRVAVSSGFFRSPEFQARGYFIYKFYSASLGRPPHYNEFMPDLAKVSGFLTDAQLEANKLAFVQEFMTRTEYVNRYGSLSNAAFVDTLIQTASLTSHPLRDAWVGLLNNGSATKAEVLRAFTESLEVYNKFYNEAFVVMQYFGYLRRDPDAAYLVWIQTMNTNGGDYRTMISGFMNSNEYVLRFGP